MVCLGNICRSPLAEGILKKKINSASAELNTQVESAGTSSYHVGEGADHRSVDIARKHQVNIGLHKSRQFVTADFDRFDKIYAMDKSNYRNIMNRARNESDRSKVEMILNVVEPGKDNDVPDPYYSGNNGFEYVYQMLDEACNIITDEIKENNIK
ncbi:MAG: protein-tyrosine-phosphatase [Bacteroidetes bacterium 4572_114]|nr:MAG: protein-tyrosine-phosphatase [Bacteroidetes bacterium 4572_114]